MRQQWHYTRAGKQFGPVPAAELKQLASSGRLSARDLVWKEGMSEWVAAYKVKGLFDSSPVAIPALSLPPSPSQMQNADACVVRIELECADAGYRDTAEENLRCE